jgi:hypothetical protein
MPFHHEEKTTASGMKALALTALLVGRRRMVPQQTHSDESDAELHRVCSE